MLLRRAEVARRPYKTLAVYKMADHEKLVRSETNGEPSSERKHDRVLQTQKRQVINDLLLFLYVW